MFKEVAEVLPSPGELRVLLFRLDCLQEGDPEVIRQYFDKEPHDEVFAEGRRGTSVWHVRITVRALQEMNAMKPTAHIW